MSGPNKLFTINHAALSCVSPSFMEGQEGTFDWQMTFWLGIWKLAALKRMPLLVSFHRMSGCLVNILGVIVGLGLAF